MSFLSCSFFWVGEIAMKKLTSIAYLKNKISYFAENKGIWNGTRRF